MGAQAKNITSAGPPTPDPIFVWAPIFLLQTSFLLAQQDSPHPPSRVLAQRALPLSLFPCMCMTPYSNRLDALIVSLSKGRRKRKKKEEEEEEKDNDE